MQLKLKYSASQIIKTPVFMSDICDNPFAFLHTLQADSTFTFEYKAYAMLFITRKLFTRANDLVSV